MLLNKKKYTGEFLNILDLLYNFNDDAARQMIQELHKTDRYSMGLIDGEKCYFCPELIVLDKHHIIPKSKGGDDSVNNVLTLCPNCHALIHRGIALLYYKDGYYSLLDPVMGNVHKACFDFRSTLIRTYHEGGYCFLEDYKKHRYKAKREQLIEAYYFACSQKSDLHKNFIVFDTCKNPSEDWISQSDTSDTSSDSPTIPMEKEKVSVD